MDSALINLGTGLVENLIVADPAVDQVDAGYQLVANYPRFVQIGTQWDSATSTFIDPGVGKTTPPPITGVKTL